MNISIPDIKVGKSNQSKKNLFSFKNDVSSTFSFGILQPLFCKQLEPRSSISIACSNFVRLAAMPCPTFGRLSYRTYKSFVPCSDIWEPYDDFKGQTPYNNGSTSYVPAYEPNISIKTLSKLLLFHRSVFTVYKVQNFYADESYDLNGPMSNSDFNTWVSQSGFATKFPEMVLFSSFICDPQQSSGGEFLYYRTGSLAVTVEAADFVFHLKDGSDHYLVCFALSWVGQQLFKALIGCGFQVNFLDERPISLLPFVSFYKAYYDMFFVQRNSNWNNTSCAKLMRYFANNPTFISADSLSGDARSTLFGAINEIGSTLYSCDPDFVSAHIRNLSSDQPSFRVPYLESFDTVSEVNFDSGDENVYINNQSDTSLSGLSRVGLQLLNKLAVRVNKNTAFGRRLDLILRNLYGAAYHHRFKTNTIGSQVTDCVISDVMSLANTASSGSGSVLGEYAGKGIGYSDPKSVKPDHFTCDTWGYVIVMSCVVPDSGYCQALDNDLLRINKDGQYQYDYDAVGFEATPQSSIFGDFGQTVYINGQRLDPSNSFGFIPRFTSRKVVQNKINGYFALRSQRRNYLPYTLDRYLTPPDIVSVSGGPYEGEYKDDPGVFASLISGTAWRYPCANGVNSNFNRIFYNTTEFNSYEISPQLHIYDNFIVHNYLDIHANCPMVGISDAFDTDAFDSDTMDVEKA